MSCRLWCLLAPAIACGEVQPVAPGPPELGPVGVVSPAPHPPEPGTGPDGAMPVPGGGLPPLVAVVADAEVVDLTHVLATEVPGGQGASLAGGGTVSLPLALGTHAWVGEQALAAPGALVGAVAVIDVAAQVAADPDLVLGPAPFEAWETRHGGLDQGQLVVIRTGWGARWAQPERYLGEGEGHPRVGPDALAWLWERGVRVLGTDAPWAGPVGDAPTADWAREGIWVHGLANLERVPEAGAALVLSPMALPDAGPRPARVLALVPAQGAGPVPASPQGPRPLGPPG